MRGARMRSACIGWVDGVWRGPVFYARWRSAVGDGKLEMQRAADVLRPTTYVSEEECGDMSGALP